jgi:diguanylate cyclase (GGDEF)-like protein
MTGASRPFGDAEPPDDRRAIRRDIAALRARIDDLERERADALDRNRLVLEVQEATNRIVAARTPDAARASLLRAMRDPLGFARAIFFTVERTQAIAVARVRVDGSDNVEPSDDRLETGPGSHILSVLRGDNEYVGRAGDLSAPLVDVREWYVLCPIGSIGVLYVDGHASREPRAWEAVQVENIASIAAIVIEKGTLLARTIELAERDALTGLYNRRSLGERLELAAIASDATNSSFAYVAIDVDDFKSINDRLGHAGGDDVLRNIARALVENSRPEDVVSRTGGDEFAMVFANVDEELARSLVARLSADLRSRDLRCSIGAALYPSDATRADEVAVAADRALYATKLAGKNGYSFDARRQPAGASGCDESTAIFHKPPTSRQMTR